MFSTIYHNIVQRAFGTRLGFVVCMSLSICINSWMTHNNVNTKPKMAFKNYFSISSDNIIFNDQAIDESNSDDEIFQKYGFDEAMIFVKGGSGGAGASTFKYGFGRQHSVPNGGSGGDGGDVYLIVEKSLNTLTGFRGRSSYKAGKGEDGGLDYSNGLSGEDCYIKVPPGTIAIDNSTGIAIGEVNQKESKLLIAKGGLGGKGNGANKRVQGEKAKASPPQAGDKKWLRLELKLVADVGLIGIPNAGKSTILDAITNAKPKIANYPFTTLVPNLGVCEVGGIGSVASGGDAMVMADIPGLIEGAHRGTGLGRRFLRHVERCFCLVHVINGDSPDPVSDFSIVNHELTLFSPILANKPQIVVLNKIDLPHVAEKQNEIVSQLLSKMTHSRILCISGAGRIGMEEFVLKTNQFLKKLKADEAVLARRRLEELRANTEDSTDDYAILIAGSDE